MTRLVAKVSDPHEMKPWIQKAWVDFDLKIHILCHQAGRRVRAARTPQYLVVSSPILVNHAGTLTDQEDLGECARWQEQGRKTSCAECAGDQARTRAVTRAKKGSAVLA